MNMDQRLGLFDHLVVLMLENRSFDNLCGYLYECDEPKQFIPDEDHVFRGVAGGDELVNYDAVVFDPPRAGARAQASALATSAVPTIVALSCNPTTFARDARLLVDGGYEMETATPIDQFLWSAHVEIVAAFRRR